MKTRNLFISLLMLLQPVFMQAQVLIVKDMQSTNDLSASQYRRNDYNGEPCALVKVQLATIGATFEGNVIQPVAYKAGEYWVYMTNGSQELRIKHPSFVPLHVKFADYGIEKGVQPLQTYNLTLLIPQLSGIEVDDGMRYLAMTVEPATALVYIDDQPQVLQNGTLSMLLPMGQHSYRVESPAYEPKRGTFTIGDGTLQLPVKLESVMASLSVSTNTPGTQIYINDQLRGTSSWTGSLTAGTYRIEGRLQGYRSHRQNLTLQQREQKQLAIPALQAITGNLNVNYQPLNAEVYLDGQLLGKSPNVFRNIIIGGHNIELRASGYASNQERITIEEGKTAMLSGTLQANKTHSAAQGVWSQMDSVSYAYGMTSTEGLDNYVQTRLKVENGIKNPMFLESLRESLNKGSVMSESARRSGWSIDQQLHETIIPNLLHEIDSLGGARRIDHQMFYEGVTDMMKNKFDRFTKESSKEYYQQHRKDKKTDNNQLFSYAAGMMSADGLKDYLLKNNMMTESTISNFILGLNEAKNAHQKEEYHARVAGYTIGGQFISSILPGIKKDMDGIVDEKIFAGFIDAIEGHNNIFTQASASSYFNEQYDAMKQKQLSPLKKAGEEFLEQNKQKPGVITTSSGLQYKVLKKGTGPKPKEDDIVKVAYEGRLIDGTVFDDSKNHNDSGTATFRLNQVIKGWVEALSMMPVGSKWELYIPEYLAYGERQAGNITPYSTLIFTVELLGIEKE